MADWNKLAKGLGNALLDHFESESERLSRNKKVSGQMREEASKLNSSLRSLRDGSYNSYSSDDNDDDYDY